MTKQSIYQFITYLNASHAIRWKSGTGQEHPHTYEINYQFQLRGNKIIRFDQIESQIAAILNPLNGSFLNETPPFDHINPTLENLTDYLCDQFAEQLKPLNCVLKSIQVSESPTRAFRIELQ
jgi:6-pyruvoyltetrahydropterin/6-carboxytetrahydropterin synthase